MGERRAWRRRVLFAAALVAALAIAAPRNPARAATTGLTNRGAITIDGTPAFPIGLSDPPPQGSVDLNGHDGLGVVVAAGVRVFRVIPLEGLWGARDGNLSDNIAYVHGWDTAAAAHGAVTFVGLAQLSRAAAGTLADRTLRQVVPALAPDAGLAIWRSTDEPQLRNIPASNLAYAYSTVHALDPDHLVALIEAASGAAAELSPYSGVTDIHGVDVYPVTYLHPDPSLTVVGQRVSLMASITPDHAVTATLQICTHASTDPLGSGRFVVPTAGQERFMAYDAIMHGARGLFFFGGDNPHCFSGSDGELGWNWSYWRTLGPIVQQLGPQSPLYPALIAPHTGINLKSTGAGINAISRTTASGEIWVLTENRSPEKTSGTISGLPAGVSSVVAYPSGAAVAVTNGILPVSLDPWGVHVYHFPAP